MSKKFGKFLLLTAFVSAAVASVVYLTTNPEVITKDEDGDDFFDLEAPKKSRSYVPLRTPGGCKPSKAVSEVKDQASAETAEEVEFTPLFETVQTIQTPAETTEEVAESVEEFFDVDDNGELIEPYGEE